MPLPNINQNPLCSVLSQLDAVQSNFRTNEKKQMHGLSCMHHSEQNCSRRTNLGPTLKFSSVQKCFLYP